MSQRRWQAPANVVEAARAEAVLQPSDTACSRYVDISRGMPVGTDTLLALTASGNADSAVTEWAYRAYRAAVAAEDSAVVSTLVASGFDETGCSPDAFGVLDPGFDGERVVAVVRRAVLAGAWERVGPEGWSECPEPVGMPYVELRGDALASCLDAVCAGASLVFSPNQPRGWVTGRGDPAFVAAAVAAAGPQTDPPSPVVTPTAGAGRAASPTGDTANVYAITDPLNAGSILTLFRVTPGPVIVARANGLWNADDGTLLGQLTGLNPPPVVSVPPAQVDAVVRQVDDFDSTHPQAASAPGGGSVSKGTHPAIAASAISHADDVMVALPVHHTLGDLMRVPGGEHPDDMHVTLAHLGHKADLPDHDTLHAAVSKWAKDVPPVQAQVSGPGLFTAGEQPVGVALVDSPALPALRQSLVGHLAEAGAPVVDNHGYTPHVTLKYGATSAPKVDNHKLDFPHAALYYGDQVTRVPLGGARNLDDSKSMTASVSLVKPKVAGLVLRAKDTGRVLMLQRSLDPTDPAAGTWEFPGGHVEGDEFAHEAAQREWEEETGRPLPGGPVSPDSPSWDSPNGVYRGYVHDVPDEDGIDLGQRGDVVNPDDPDGDMTEAIAWWDPTLLTGNPAVRSELAQTAHLVHGALDPTHPMAASAHHDRRVREAKDADSAFDASRAEADHAEQERRKVFETHVASRHQALTGEGVEPDEAAGAVRREILAEEDRRELWEADRAQALQAEKARRIRVHPEIRLSSDLAKRHPDVQAQEPAPVLADAAPHSGMPDALERYWTAGAGAAKVRWGVRGDWARCRDHLVKYMDLYKAKASCNELHKLVTGRWTGSKANKIAES